MDDIDVIELNEAFAAQSLYVIRKGNWDINKVNINGGAIALVRDGDEIFIDAVKNEINLVVSEQEIERRTKEWKVPDRKDVNGVLKKYSKIVSSASEGAVTTS